jgi:hypothetical protein
MECVMPGNEQEQGAQSGPMAMAKRMMAQMGQGGSPMEMMRKMMGSGSGEGTPELRAMFGEWFKGLEEKALAALKEGEKDAAALGTALGVSEESARYVMTQLAAAGKIALIGRSKG